MAVTLYLDLDGCLHPDDAYVLPGGEPELRTVSSLFMHAPALAAAIAPFAVDIVLSTTWVPEFGAAAITGRLPQSLADRVVGSTYDGALAINWRQLSR